MVLEAHRTFLAKHHHFESIEAAFHQGADIIPNITVVREWEPPKRVADGQRGRLIRSLIAQLERLIKAYKGNHLPQHLTL